MRLRSVALVVVLSTVAGGQSLSADLPHTTAIARAAVATSGVQKPSIPTDAPSTASRTAITAIALGREVGGTCSAG